MRNSLVSLISVSTVCATILISGCGGSDGDSTIDLSGTWNLRADDDDGTMTIVQSGNTFTGTGRSGPGSFEIVNGVVSGTDVSFRIVSRYVEGYYLDLVGTVSSGGGIMGGTALSSQNISAIWTASKTSSSPESATANVAGTWTYSDVVVVFTQNGTSLSGTVTEEGRTYPEPLTGTVSGNDIRWTATNEGRWGTFVGTVDGDTMVGTFTKDTDSVKSWTMTRQ